MKSKLIAGVIGTALTLGPICLAQQRQDPQTREARSQSDSAGVEEAIRFQHAKDRADARQAAMEKRHPSLDDSSAQKNMDDTKDGRHLLDPGPAPVKK